MVLQAPLAEPFFMTINKENIKREQKKTKNQKLVFRSEEYWSKRDFLFQIKILEEKFFLILHRLIRYQLL